MPEPTPALRPVAPDIWESELHLHEGGLHLRMRMTVVRREGRALWLHSPIRIDDRLAAALAEAGEVRDVVAPNRFHHRYAAAAKARYPNAKLWGAPGLAEKRPRIRFDATLSEQPGWGADLEAVFLEGAPMWSEHVFFHAPSRTLVCTDLLNNIPDESSFATRLLYRGMGVWRRFGTNRLWRWFAADRAALSASIERVLRWDVRRVLVAHGDPIEIDGRERLAAAFARAYPPAHDKYQD